MFIEFEPVSCEAGSGIAWGHLDLDSGLGVSGRITYSRNSEKGTPPQVGVSGGKNSLGHMALSCISPSLLWLVQ